MDLPRSGHFTGLLRRTLPTVDKLRCNCHDPWYKPTSPVSWTHAIAVLLLPSFRNYCYEQLERLVGKQCRAVLWSSVGLIARLTMSVGNHVFSLLPSFTVFIAPDRPSFSSEINPSFSTDRQLLSQDYALHCCEKHRPLFGVCNLHNYHHCIEFTHHLSRLNAIEIIALIYYHQ